MSQQFGTFDNAEDRREIFILMERLGGDLPMLEARKARAEYLQGLIPLSVSSLAEKPMVVNPDQCDPLPAYFLFVAIVGVLGVPIGEAAKRLDAFVTKKAWHKHDRRLIICGS